MKRLYFLTPDLRSVHGIVRELKQEGIHDEDIHIVGKDHHAIEEANLHEANVLQTTDLINAVERGVVAGGTTGLIAGIAAVTFPPAGLVLGGGAILGLGAIGAGFGAWVSSMIGIGIKDEVIEKFEKAVEQGELLLLVDVSQDREADIVDMIHKHHPEAIIEGVSPQKAAELA